MTITILIRKSAKSVSVTNYESLITKVDAAIN